MKKIFTDQRDRFNITNKVYQREWKIDNLARSPGPAYYD